jgi:hypothetical protein
MILKSGISHVVPDGKMRFLWFVVQIGDNIIFLFVGLLPVRLFSRYWKTAVQTTVNNFYEVHFTQWTSLDSVFNLLSRSFTRLLIFREPQTMYFLLAIILWAVKQFVTKALIIKKENEAFV